MYQETPLISFKHLGRHTSQYMYNSGVSWSNRAEIMKGNEVCMVGCKLAEKVN